MNDVQDLRIELEALRAEVRALRDAVHDRPSRRRRTLGRLFLGVLVACLAFSVTTAAQLVTFTGGEPALASEVNANFALLQTWLEQKVGTAGDALVRIGATADVGSTGTSGAVVIGDTGGGNMGLDGNEIQARNGNTASTLTLQNEGGALNIGNSSMVTINKDLTVTANANLGSIKMPYRNWYTDTAGAGGAAIYNDNSGYKMLMIAGNDSLTNDGRRRVGIWDDLQVRGTITFLDTRSVTPTEVNGGQGWGSWQGFSYCPADQYVCGMEQRVEGSQGGGDDTAVNDIRMACCTLGH